MFLQEALCNAYYGHSLLSTVFLLTFPNPSANFILQPRKGKRDIYNLIPLNNFIELVCASWQTFALFKGPVYGNDLLLFLCLFHFAVNHSCA